MMSSNFIAPKRGKDYWNEVCTVEYLEWQEWWNTLTYEDKYEHAMEADESSVVAYQHDDERVNLINFAKFYTAAHGIEKYKPEYQTTQARDRVRQGYNPSMPEPTHVRVELPNTLSMGDDEEDDRIESKLVWPSAPAIGKPMENFDMPSWYADMALMVSMGRHIAIEGPPSIGKDTAVEQLAATMGKPLATLGGDAGFRTRDLKGDQQIVDGTSFFELAEYVTAAISGWWVLLTEVNAADPSALMYINRQLAAPYTVNFGGKSFPVHPDFRLFVTYNHGLVGTKPLPQSFKDRFYSIKESFFTETQLTKRMNAMGMSPKPEHEMGNSIIIQFGIAMWEAHTQGKMRYQITTRRLKDAVDLMVVGNKSVKYALRAAVLGAIDSPIEYKAAETVLAEVMRGK